MPTVMPMRRRFVDERLMPGMQKIGIQSQPEVEMAEAHAVFAPGYRVAGARSMM